MNEKDLNYIGEYSLVEIEYKNLNSTKERKQHIKDILKIDPALHVEIGDFIIADWEEGFVMGIITKIYPKEITQETMEASNKAKTWIIDKIDLSKHKQRQENTERKKFIMDELNRRKEEVEERAAWKLLAKEDPLSNKLVKELENLK